MELELAEQYAKEVIALLRPYTERIEIAGGIRRRKPDPHDIELVVNPRIDMIGEAFPVNVFHKRMEECIDYGFLEYGDKSKDGKRAPFSEKYYRVKYHGEKLDIFSVLPPAQFGVIYAIRTGDADFSHALVQAGWKHLIIFRDGAMWQNGVFPVRLIDTPEEEDVFKMLRLPYPKPEERTKEWWSNRHEQ